MSTTSTACLPSMRRSFCQTFSSFAPWLLMLTARMLLLPALMVTSSGSGLVRFASFSRSTLELLAPENCHMFEKHCKKQPF